MRERGSSCWSDSAQMRGDGIWGRRGRQALARIPGSASMVSGMKAEHTGCQCRSVFGCDHKTLWKFLSDFFFLSQVGSEAII